MAETEVKQRKKPPVNHHGGTKGAIKPTELLRDMRKVYRSKGKRGHDQLCELYGRDPTEFITQLQRAEKDFSADKRAARALMKGQPGAGAAVAQDPGTDRCLELVDKLLAEGAP